MSSVEPGFNSDIVHRGMTFHVQTEDWGHSNPFVVTQVYQSGTVVVRVKTPYVTIHEKSLSQGRLAIRLGMREQHQQILDQLVSGELLQQRLK